MLFVYLVSLLAFCTLSWLLGAHWTLAYSRLRMQSAAKKVLEQVARERMIVEASRDVQRSDLLEWEEELAETETPGDFFG